MQNIFLNSFLFCAMFVLLNLPTTTLNAQITLTATGGTLGGSYTTLGGAFTAINAGTHTGTITIDVTANTTELSSAVLNASGSGAASYTGITISPLGGTAAIIDGAIAGVLVDLNGADNVIFNGLNTGGNSLTLNNSSTTATATVRFTNDASNNTILNCTLLGATSTVVTGTVVFATAIATGNDNNLITSCTFNNSGANFASTALYSAGSATMENSGNTISNNNFANFFSATVINYGIFISTNSTDWTISGNKFYQNATRTYTTANTHAVIQVSTGNNHTISSNVIGFSNAGGTGVYTMQGTVATRVIAINLAVGTTMASTVQGNTISGISLATTSGASTANGVLCGINITSGAVNVGTSTPNTIGASTGVDAIVATATTTGAIVVGINSSSTGIISIMDNMIGALSSSGTTATAAGSVAGINISGASASMTISGNTIGNTTTDNMRGGTSGLTTGSSLALGINITSSQLANVVTNNTIQNLTSYGTNTGSVARGIYITIGTITHNISGNTVRNLASNSTSASFTSGQCPVIGIYLGGGNNASISGNTIYNLALTNSTALGGAALGISIAANTNATISKNTIYDITNASTSVSTTAPGAAAGIFIRSSTTGITIVNNMISLGTGQTTNTAFIGIWGQHGSTPDPLCKIYYNTVHITGTAASGAQPSMCYQRGDFSTTVRTAPVDIRNNIFNNERTGGTGFHFAIANNYGVATSSATGWGANASNYNALNANAATVGHWTTAGGFSAWQTASASDVNSATAVTLNFTNPANNLHINTALATGAESAGTAISGFDDDIDGNVRFGSGGYTGNGTAPDLGADEFDLVLPNCSAASGGTISPAIVNVCEGLTTILSSPTATTGTGISYQWKVATVSGGPYSNVVGGSGATTRTYTTGALVVGTYFYVLETTCSFGSLVGLSNEVTVNVGTVPTVAVSPTSANYCTPSGAAIALTASGADTYTWSPAAGLSATTGGTVNATPASNTTYTVLGTAANGCTATATTSITTAPAVSLSSVTASPANLCSGANSQLQATINALNLNTYTFSAGTGAVLDPMVGATAVLNPNNDDTPTAAPANIGFTFPFNGTTYTQYSVSPDGWLLLGGGAAANQFTNAVTSTLNTPKIYAFWDDLATGIDGSVQTLLTGTAPNQIFIVQWFVTAPRATTGPANTTFQLWMYENGTIELRYGTMGTSTSISAGITASATNFHSITYTTNTSSKITPNDVNATSPAAGTIYTYTPGAATYTWGPATFLNSTTIANPLASSVTATTVYTVTATFGVCSDVNSVTLTAGNPLSSAAAITPGNSVCQNVMATLNANPVGGGGPYTYAWTGPNGFTASIENPVIASAATTDAGTYNVTITDNCGATTTGSVSLTVNTLPTVLATAASSVYCTPGTGVDITGSGANTYTWSPSTGLSATTGTTVTATPSAATTYTVVGTDANGCTASHAVTMTVASAVTSVTASATPSTICADSSVLMAISTNSTATYCEPVYGNGTGFGDYISSVQLNTLNNTSVGAATPFYTLYPTAGTTTTTLTAGSTYTITLSAGTYTSNDVAAWIDFNQNGNLADSGEKLGETDNLGASPITTDFTFTVPVNAVNGVTRLRVREMDHTGTNDMDPCTAQSSFGETEDYNITIVGGVDPNTYNWSPAPFFATNSGATVTATGITTTTTFTVTATNAFGCSNTNTVIVNKSSTPIAVTATETSPSSCSANTGVAEATVTGGTGTYNILWSNNATTTTVMNLAAGTYMVTATDTYGCESTNSVTVTSPAPTITISNTMACGMTTLDAGTGFASYLWNDNSTAQTLVVTTGGVSMVTITDGTGCTATSSITATVNSLPTATMSSNDVLCMGSSTGNATVTASGNGGFTYNWSNSSTDMMATGLAAGAFIVTVTDANNCMATFNVTVNEPSSSVSSSVTITDAFCSTCNDGTATVTTSGGTAGYSYLWSDAETTSNRSDLLPGVYSLTTTDANGCQDVSSVTVSFGTTISTINSSLFENVRVYPNPTMSTLYVSELPVGSMVRLVDALGRVLVQQQTTTTIHSFDMSNLAPAMYFIEMESNGQRRIEKVIRQD